jgi:hypothetical protein
MRSFWFVLLALPGAACWSPRYFTPRENVDATAPDGTPAAQYTVPAPAGATPPAAEVRVWSGGAQARFTDDDREIVELHVGFELENNGQVPLQLDLGTVACEELLLDGVLQPTLQPLRIQGDGTAPPGATARVDLTFEPATTVPRDVDRFAIRFVVREGEQPVLQQSTPFQPWVRNYDDYHHRFWGGWGWGFGLGFGSHWHCH